MCSGQLFWHMNILADELLEAALPPFVMLMSSGQAAESHVDLPSLQGGCLMTQTGLSLSLVCLQCKQGALNAALQVLTVSCHALGHTWQGQ